MLNLKDYQRVRYTTNPLVEVLCQIRFPELLQLETSPPSDFQREIANTYPIAEKLQGIEISLQSNLRSVPPNIRQSANFRFGDREGKWETTVTSNFLTLVSRAYTTWEEFHDRFMNILQPFLRLYSPPLVLRTGLRYKNIIDINQVGRGAAKWSDLISPQIGGLLTGNFIPESAVDQASGTVHLNLDGTEITINHGLVTDTLVLQRKGYLLDYDIFSGEKYDATEKLVSDRIGHFHKFAGPLFRQSITDELHAALGPIELE